jgi:hypothetical protein
MPLERAGVAAHELRLENAFPAPPDTGQNQGGLADVVG